MAKNNDKVKMYKAMQEKYSMKNIQKKASERQLAISAPRESLSNPYLMQTNNTSEVRYDLYRGLLKSDYLKNMQNKTKLKNQMIIQKNLAQRKGFFNLRKSKELQATQKPTIDDYTTTP